MDLTQKSIEEYRKIYKKVYKEDITEEEAREQGERLVRFFKILIEIDERKHIITIK
jgi:hypothetical protein